MKTIDGVVIEDGMRVWDYDLDRVIVDLDRPPHQDNGASNWWFDVRPVANPNRTKLMSNDRLWARHPSTGEKA